MRSKSDAQLTLLRYGDTASLSSEDESELKTTTAFRNALFRLRSFQKFYQADSDPFKKNDVFIRNASENFSPRNPAFSASGCGRLKLDF
jgi:hypothetical protein